jgi:hypothetical protein
MSYTRQPYSGPKGLDPRKRQGNIAWLEKSVALEAVVGGAGQGKTCMVKATLPEPKFRVIYLAIATQQWPRRGSEYSKVHHEPSTSCASSLLGTALFGDKGTNWGPNQVDSPYSRHHRMACSRRAGTPRPVWPRSRNSTRKPGVTPGTGAPSGTHGRWYKGGATLPKAEPAGGSPAAYVASPRQGGTS